MSTILITGAAGGIGTLMRTRMARPGRVLRLLDLAPLGPVPLDPAPIDPAAEPGSQAAVGSGAANSADAPAEELVQASVTDLDAMLKACEGVDAVIHLGGLSGEASWERISEVNIQGTYTVFEAARQRGVPRVVFASSNHAVGFYTPDNYPLPEAVVPLPDTYYGVSKVAGEALGALYAKRYGIDVISIRILTCFPKPPNRRALSTWLSPDDCARLFEACLAAPSPGYRVVYGVSANTRGGWVSLDGARALGYEPHSDAEEFAAEVLAAEGVAAGGSAAEASAPEPPTAQGIDPDDEPERDDPVLRHLGGAFCLPDYDADAL